MISSDLAKLMVPFALLGNRHALSINYKTLAVTPGMIRGCSPFGILEADAKLGLTEPFFVDTASFSTFVKSLPDGKEVRFEVKGAALMWECGDAGGRLALTKEAVSIPDLIAPNAQPWKVTPEVKTAIRLGGISCGDASLKSAGVYGIALDNRRNVFCVYSSDDITISYAECSRLLDMPDLLTIKPEAAQLMDLVMDADKEAMMSASERAIYLAAGGFRLAIQPIPPMQRDIRALAENFASNEAIAKLPHDRLADFIKATIGLTEGAKNSSVEISAAAGAVRLTFSGDRAEAEEYFMAEGLDIPELPAIQVHAARMARALQRTDTLILDHIERGIIILASADPHFRYLMSKRAGKAG